MKLNLHARPKPRSAECSYPCCRAEPVKRGFCERHYKTWTKMERARADIVQPNRQSRYEDMSAVYIIGFLETAYVKIGIAEDVVARLNTMQTGCPYQMMPFGALYAGRPEVTLIECLAHKTLLELSIPSRGEWFEVPPLDAMAVIGKLAQQNDIWLDTPLDLAGKIERQDYDHTQVESRGRIVRHLRHVSAQIEMARAKLQDA